MKEKIKDTTKELISKTKSVYHSTKDSIQSIGDNTPKPRIIYELDELYKNGEIVGEKESLIQSLYECFSIEESGGRIASAPELVLMRNKDRDHCIWETSFDTFSSEHIGVDTKGLFGPAGRHLIVFVHNSGIPGIHTILDENINASHVEKGVRYKQEFFDQLLEGKTQDGLDIDLYPIDKYNQSYKPTPYGLVMPITEEEMERRKKLVFAKGINEKFPEQSYYLSPIAKGRSGLDTESIKEYVENCLISTDNKPFFFDYFDYDLPFYGEAEVRIINVTRLGFQINNQNNPHIFYGIKAKEKVEEEDEKKLES